MKMEFLKIVSLFAIWMLAMGFSKYGLLGFEETVLLFLSCILIEQLFKD